MDELKVPTPSLGYKFKNFTNIFDIAMPKENIENVSIFLTSYVKERFRTQKLLYFFIFIIWIICSYVFYLKVLPLINNNNVLLLFVPLLVPFIVLLSFYTQLRQKLLQLFYKQFAKINNFSFNIQGSTEGLNGSLFSIGHTHSVKCDIKGLVGDNPIRLCNFYYTAGSGKSSCNYESTVFKIDFNKALAPILLVSEKTSYGGFRPKFLNSKKLELEQPYEKFFDLYVSEKMEIEALQVFDFKFLEKVKSTWPEFSVEFLDCTIYIYCNRVIENRITLENMFAFAKYLAEELEPKLYSMSGSVKAMQELNPLNKK